MNECADARGMDRVQCFSHGEVAGRVWRGGVRARVDGRPLVALRAKAVTNESEGGDESEPSSESGSASGSGSETDVSSGGGSDTGSEWDDSDGGGGEDEAVVFDLVPDAGGRFHTVRYGERERVEAMAAAPVLEMGALRLGAGGMRRERPRPPPIRTGQGALPPDESIILPPIVSAAALASATSSTSTTTTTTNSTLTGAPGSGRSGVSPAPRSPWPPAAAAAALKRHPNGGNAARSHSVPLVYHSPSDTAIGPGEVMVPLQHRLPAHRATVLYAFPSWTADGASPRALSVEPSTPSPSGAVAAAAAAAMAVGSVVSPRRPRAPWRWDPAIAMAFSLDKRNSARDVTAATDHSWTPPVMSHVELAQLLGQAIGAVAVASTTGTEAATTPLSYLREVVSCVQDGKAYAADVYDLLRHRGHLYRCVHEQLEAAHRALLLVLWLVLEGPIGCLAEAILNGMEEYCAALAEHWQTTSAKATDSIECGGEAQAAVLAKLAAYLAGKLHFHGTYTAFESNYALDRFLRRYQLEQADAVRAPVNRQLAERVFSSDAAVDLLAVLHQLLDAHLELEMQRSAESPTTPLDASSMSISALTMLVSLMAQDAANLYDTLLCCLSRLHPASATRVTALLRLPQPTASPRIRNELAVVLQELCVHLRVLFTRVTEAGLVTDLPTVPYQLLIPAPEASFIESRFPRTIVCRFTRFRYLHEALTPQHLNEALAA
ncbi:hypothetical protein CDCA_CDCA12G3413 [Cyanidium caldarium]|uniref:Uncharacterized protein n=1 Tax=Cyanidium caldarium TaxID=2771 RepID=A0AAV9IYJ8_CYACA|nr:hypothetical protein CDCA_CDCA12G3413 [Cyanidium caldarium]